MKSSGEPPFEYAPISVTQQLADRIRHEYGPIAEAFFLEMERTSEIEAYELSTIAANLLGSIILDTKNSYRPSPSPAAYSAVHIPRKATARRRTCQRLPYPNPEGQADFGPASP